MSRIESYVRMFDPEHAHGEVITRVEIPLIQRDYAQGRRGEKVDAIRRNFLAVLHDAIAGDEAAPVGLDFVYGERMPDGTLHPLDGQQRLTTLFLLHWYLAARVGELRPDAAWTCFSYETRPSARRFCERLISATPPPDTGLLSDWLQEQPWYLFVWRYDPTINAMLVMIDAIDEWFRDVDPVRAWSRLTDVENPVVWFHLLPLPDMGSAEDLYVKMNSRGRPLTDFETFKARFEKTIEWSPRAGEFALKADTVWSDMLWRFRGEDDLVDDEFLRLFDFVCEVCEWSDDDIESASEKTLIARAERVFASSNKRCIQHLDFLFTTFDLWVDRDVTATFESLFRAPSEEGGEGLPLFFRDPNVSLFESACRSYGESSGRGNRTFTLGQTLLLLAVVLHLDSSSTDFIARLRSLRNLIEGSQFEMRLERMPRLVADTRALILDGELPQHGGSFAPAQITDEMEKRAFLAEHPECADPLKRLEDHPLLKGSTTVFALDANTLESRALDFDRLMSDPDLWWDLTGALLTFGEYQRPRDRGGKLDDSAAFQFGTWDPRYRDAWREVLVGRSRLDSAGTGVVLNDLLERISDSHTPLDETLRTIQQDWLLAREGERSFDWRYYLVKYPSMRAGASGLYYAQGRRMGFSLTNLPGGKKYRNAKYYDPYLQAMFTSAGEPDDVMPLWFSGYEWDPRWLVLRKSRVGLRPVPAGLELRAPSDSELLPTFEGLVVDRGGQRSNDNPPGCFKPVQKATDDPGSPDAEDRVLMGAHLIRDMLDAGL